MNSEFVNSQFPISEQLTKTCDTIAVMWAIGERLRERREAVGIQQQDAAQEIGYAKSYVSQLEKGGNKPNWELLGAFVRLYQTSADYVLGLTNDPTPATERGEWPAEAIAAAQLINTAPPEKRDGVLAVLKAAVELTQAEMLEPPPAPANSGGGVTLSSQQGSEGQDDLSIEKDTWLALLKTVLSPEDYQRLEDSVNRGEMPTQAELALLIKSSKHDTLPNGTERLNHTDLVN